MFGSKVFYVLFLIFIIKVIYCEQVIFYKNINNDNSVFNASCNIFKNKLNYIIAPCAKSKKLKKQLNKIKKNSFNDNLVSDEPYEIINNLYAYQAMVYGGAESCANENTEFKCSATGDRLYFEAQLTCKSSSEPCSFTQTTSTSVSLTSGTNDGSGISYGNVNFNKGSSKGYSVDSGLSQTIGLNVPAGKTVTFYTFYLMKECSFSCENKEYSLLTYEGNKKGTAEDRILLWLVDLVDFNNSEMMEQENNSINIENGVENFMACTIGQKKCQFDLVLKCNYRGTWDYVKNCKPKRCSGGNCV